MRKSLVGVALAAAVTLSLVGCADDGTGTGQDGAGPHGAEQSAP